jgi:hypothetical protein
MHDHFHTLVLPDQSNVTLPTVQAPWFLFQSLSNRAAKEVPARSCPPSDHSGDSTPALDYTLTPRRRPVMQLSLVRDIFTEKSTTGKLYVDGVFECYTLEDKDRFGGTKVYGQSAIPAGQYGVIVNRSPRFGKDMPLLLNVPGYSGVRIHPGNKAEDTEGCLLVGQTRTVDFIGSSRAAYAALLAKINAALAKKETVTIQIVQEVPQLATTAAKTA